MKAMTFERIKQQHHVISALLLALLFFPLLWISLYDYPSGDDYRALVRARELGAAGAARWWYFNWTGRYTSFFLQSLIASRGGWLTLYKIVPVVLFLLGFACLFYFVKTFFGAGLDKRTRFSLTAALYIFLIATTPDPATCFYWLSTNMQYAGAVFLSLLVFALYIKLDRAAATRDKAIIFLLIAILIALVAGLNEISTLYLIGAFGSISFLHLSRFRKVNRAGSAFFMLCVSFGLIALLSPGNLIRVRTLGAQVGAAEVVFGAIGFTLYLFIELLTSTPLLVASVLYLLFLFAHRDKLRAPLLLLKGLRWWWVLLALLCTVAFANAALFYAVGVGVNSMPYRVKNVYTYGIVLGWFFMLTTLFVDLSRREINFRVPRWATVALAAFVLCFVATGFGLKFIGTNVVPATNKFQQAFTSFTTKSVYANAYLDILSGRAKWYEGQNAERARRLSEATAEPLDFPLYSHVPETIYVQDVTHPYGAPEVMSEALTGRVRQLHFVTTGTPAPQKEGF
jgi:hypothetical protein